jgi:hypothetical protein
MPDEYEEADPVAWPAGLSVIVATEGDEPPEVDVAGVGDGPGVYVIVRTIPEDEPSPEAV